MLQEVSIGFKKLRNTLQLFATSSNLLQPQ